MERNKKSPLLFLPLALLCVCAVGEENCLDDSRTDLTCYTDYNRFISCVWNSTSASADPDNVCTIDGKLISSRRVKRESSCKLESVNASRPTLKNCSMDFKREGNFQTIQIYSITLTCNSVIQTQNMLYKPACHIKLYPPPQPVVNLTTISWIPQATEHSRLKLYACQLQWKAKDQSWTDPSVQRDNIKEAQCNWNCSVELYMDQLMQGERYEARLRVKAADANTRSTWSDWGPTASWVSHTGRTKQQPSDLNVGVLSMVATAAAFAVFLVVIRLKTDKTTWVYIVKRIRGPPLPNPGKSFLQDINVQNWLSPPFTSESFHSLLKPVEIVSVEVTSAVDAVTPCGLEAALLEKMRSERVHESTSSNFSNPSYSQLGPPPSPPPVSSLTAGNLAPIAADTPYGPVGGQTVKEEQEVRGKEVDIRLLLSESGNGSESMPVVSDYEKVEKIQVERVRLQSLDSGVCSGEEVSQESLEADSINVSESEEESEEGNAKVVDFQKLFEGGGGSIQVCSGYEKVETLQADGPELLSVDSGDSGVGEEQLSQEDDDKTSESTGLLLPPPTPPPTPPCSSSPCFPQLFTPKLLDFAGSGLSPALPSDFLEKMALMSSSRSVEPSGDGYL